ncbi:hypothetical protein [uncultured Nitratireductor sp.]|uniref:hypothetical protein n=1 Tax=uncultured Nitratireductor sp. TaxID=520953 RepID=UPI0025DBE126|nr:hypothetical protein [uncultured Nitratireductor sp.]
MNEDDFWDLVDGIVKRDGFEPFMEPERLLARLKPYDDRYRYERNRTEKTARDLGHQLRIICEAVEAV